MFKNSAKKDQRRYDVQTAMQSSWPTVPLDPMAMPDALNERTIISDTIGQGKTPTSYDIEQILNVLKTRPHHRETAMSAAFEDAVWTKQDDVIFENLEKKETI